MNTNPDGSVERSSSRTGIFAVGLAALVVAGVLARWVYIEHFAPSTRFFDDSIWYYLQATNIRTGIGYVNIYRQLAGLAGHPEQAGVFATAYWPPLFPAFLAGIQEVFGVSMRTAQEGGLLTGAATVLVSGLLGRAIGG